MYGVAIGDALGATGEFLTKEQIQSQFGRITDIVGGGWLHLQPGETTDDTAMTVAVARGIIQDPHNPIPRIGEEFLRWYATKPKDVGNIIDGVLGSYRGDWFDAAKQRHRADGMTAGNGSLMRCLPVALAYADEHRMVEVTRLQSKMTHYDDLADEACVLYNRVAHRVMSGDMLTKALLAVIGGTRYEDALYRQPNVPPSGFVCHTFEWVVYLTSHLQDFDEIVLEAANNGDDADTVGAIAGGIAGLACGFTRLPRRYVEKIRIYSELDELSYQLLSVRDRMDARS